MSVHVIWNYRGHNAGFFQRGPNWFQVTLPSSRKRRRCAVILWWGAKLNGKAANTASDGNKHGKRLADLRQQRDAAASRGDHAEALILNDRIKDLKEKRSEK